MHHTHQTDRTSDEHKWPEETYVDNAHATITQQQAQMVIFLLLTAILLLAIRYLPGSEAVSDLSAEGGPSAEGDRSALATAAAVDAAVFPIEGISTEANWGDVLPELIERGVIDQEKFAGIFARSGNPLSAAELALLTAPANTTPIVFTSANARFTVNALWALGLAQESAVLLEGPMRTGGTATDRFASTGGWTLGKAGAMEYYAKWNLLGLTETDQQRVTKIAEGIYRPCCGNSTAFPDCNHGMAMLGLIELMVSQGATDEQIYRAALAANTYWFPQNVAELATYFSEIEGTPWASVNPVRVLSREFSSSTGAQRITVALRERELLPEAPSGGGSCGA